MNHKKAPFVTGRTCSFWNLGHLAEPFVQNRIAKLVL